MWWWRGEQSWGAERGFEGENDRVRGLAGEVLTVKSLKDVPGRKGRPCTGLDTIAVALATATGVGFGPPALPGGPAASLAARQLHGNAKHAERSRKGAGPETQACPARACAARGLDVLAGVWPRGASPAPRSHVRTRGGRRWL